MAKSTKIQWCDSTINPAAGCDGCELWATRPQVVTALIGEIVRITGKSEPHARAEVTRFAEKNTNLPKKDLIKHCIEEAAAASSGKIPKRQAKALIDTLKGRLLKCYAGKQTENRGGHVKGFPLRFEEPTCFPGRMAVAAAWKDLRGTDRPDKPWLNGLARLIFVSDMGDALSSCVPFEYLLQEIIKICASPKGRRHIWLWVTKRPARMAEFSEWLLKQGIPWPDNLIAMTTVTSEKTISRIADLRRVKCRFRGLSVEPLWSAVKLSLDNINWVIVGGESGPGAEPFHLEWAREIREQCHRAGVAFFMKQLGRHPIDDNHELTLIDKHGGDWAEWPEDLRMREMPVAFQTMRSEPAEKMTTAS